MASRTARIVVFLTVVAVGCDGGTIPGDDGGGDGAVGPDASATDGGGGGTDAGTDAGGTDAGGGGTDAGDAGGPCAELDCSGLDDMCNIGVCNPATGACEAMARADDTACDDGDPCTTTDVCTTGTCAGTAMDCSGLDDMCNVGMCDATGACVASPVADTTVCDDGDPCTATDMCTGGTCAGTAMDCTSFDDMCNVGTCNASGTCEAMSVVDGTGCADTHACTTGDACSSGTCGGTLSCRVPSGIVAFGTPTDSTIRGSTTGGTLFEDGCGPDEVLIGVSGFTRAGGGYLSQIQALCGTLSLTGSGLGPYAVSVAAGSTGPLRGLIGDGAAFTATCPADQVVVGFTGHSGSLVDQLALRCAPLSITETPTEFVATVGTVTTITPVGGTGGTAFADTDCPAGEVAAEARIRAGDSIDGFGIGCKPVRLTYPLVTSAPTATTVRGGGGGTAFADGCPAGSLVVGYAGNLDAAGYHGQIQAICQRYDVIGPVAAPSGLLAIGATTTTTLRGLLGAGPAWTRTCAADSAAVGFDGRSGSLIDQLTFQCAPLGVSGASITLGSPISLTAIGGAGGTAFATVSCAAGSATSQARGRAGDGLDAFAMGCSTLSF